MLESNLGKAEIEKALIYRGGNVQTMLQLYLEKSFTRNIMIPNFHED